MCAARGNGGYLCLEPVCVCMGNNNALCGQSIKYSSLYSQVQSVARLLFPPRITDSQKQNYKESGGQTGGRKVGTTENKKTTGDWWKSYTCNVACFIFRSGWVDGLLNVWMEGGMVGG